MVVESRKPLLARDLHHRTPPPLQGFLQELGQHALQRLPLEMVE
jgi:hypothetical protein